VTQKIRKEFGDQFVTIILLATVMKILKFIFIALANNNNNNNKNNNNMSPTTDATPSIATMADIYKSLEKKLRPKIHQPGQFWIGVGGGPGSGKSTSAEAVASLLNEIHPGIAIVIQMDGWHWPKDKLIELHGEENGYKRRGAPWTFDVKACFDALSEAKQTGDASLPIYSREISDPVPNGIQLTKDHKIVLVEGIYVLHKDDDEWGKLDTLWNERWFIKCQTRDEQVNRLVRRSLLTWHDSKRQIWGPGAQGARKRAEFNDVKNMDIVSYCETYADEVIISQ
jgi:pantothenate kinase